MDLYMKKFFFAAAFVLTVTVLCGCAAAGGAELPEARIEEPEAQVISESDAASTPLPTPAVTLSPNPAPTVSPEPDRSEENRIYIPIIQNVLAWAGPGDFDKSGLLLDLNRDGTDELVIQYTVYSEASPKAMDHMEVWTQEDGELLRMFFSGDHNIFYGGVPDIQDIGWDLGTIWMTEDRTMLAYTTAAMGGSSPNRWQSWQCVFLEVEGNICRPVHNIYYFRPT